MKKIIELNNILIHGLCSGHSMKTPYIAIILIPKPDLIEVPIDLGGKTKNLEGSVI